MHCVLGVALPRLHATTTGWPVEGPAGWVHVKHVSAPPQHEQNAGAVPVEVRTAGSLHASKGKHAQHTHGQENGHTGLVHASTRVTNKLSENHCGPD